MMWTFYPEPLREHRPGPPAGGRTWEKTLAGVELGSDNHIEEEHASKDKRLSMVIFFGFRAQKYI